MSTYRLATFLTLALVSLIVVLAEADLPVEAYELLTKRQGTSKYCGTHLSNTLQLICHGLYNSMFKRDDQQEMDLDEFLSYDNYPFRSPARTRSILKSRFGAGHYGAGRFRRESRGVHDECCVKSCTVSELVSYCATPP